MSRRMGSQMRRYQRQRRPAAFDPAACGDGRRAKLRDAIEGRRRAAEKQQKRRRDESTLADFGRRQRLFIHFLTKRTCK